MAIQTFTAGQVLTAAQMTSLQANDYNQTVSTKTASYTLVAADKGTRVVMNSASATTITVNTSLFSAGDTLVLQNIGAGVCTVTAGTATVSTAGSLAIPQNGSGVLYFTSAGVSIFYPSAGANNFVQQVNSQTGAVATGTTTTPYDDTIPQNTEGTQFLSLAITPTSATNILVIEVSAIYSSDTARNVTTALFQDSTANALAASIAFAGVQLPETPTFNYRMTAGTTSATTFKVRIGPDGAATITFNGVLGARKMGGVLSSSITITEVTP